MRLIALCAAVGTAVAIPGLAGAGDPSLLIQLRPSAPIVLESGGRRDALVTLEVRNPGDKAVRVDRFKITWFAGDTVTGTLDPAVPVLLEAGLASDPRIDPGATQTWEALCLAPPTPATDRARFELELVERRGWRSIRSTQLLDVPLRARVPPVTIALPVRDAWRVEQGHTCGTAHRRGRMGGEFAWDFVALDETGRSGTARFGASHRNAESATFGRPVLAPVAGRVVTVVSSVPDNDEQQAYPRRSIVDSVRLPRWFFGNYVVIDAGGVFVMLAHLRQDSIVVGAGATVAEGDVIASAGNSGNTMLPHLHVQVMDRADPADPAVSGLPAVFRDYYEATVRGDGAHGEALLRRVLSGDPPAGAIVFAPDAPPAAK